MLMLSGPVELLFLLFLIAARTCSVVMFICVGCSSTLVGFRHPVTALHALFSSVFSFWA